MIKAPVELLVVLHQALAEGLTAEAEGRVLSLEEAAAQVKAKIKAVADRRGEA